MPATRSNKSSSPGDGDGDGGRRARRARRCQQPAALWLLVTTPVWHAGCLLRIMQADRITCATRGRRAASSPVIVAAPNPLPWNNSHGARTPNQTRKCSGCNGITLVRMSRVFAAAAAVLLSRPHAGSHHPQPPFCLAASPKHTARAGACCTTTNVQTGVNQHQWASMLRYEASANTSAPGWRQLARSNNSRRGALLSRRLVNVEGASGHRRLTRASCCVSLGTTATHHTYHMCVSAGLQLRQCSSVKESNTLCSHAPPMKPNARNVLAN